MNVVTVTGPANEPLALQETKDYLRVDSSDEDAFISALIVAAREYAETATNRKLMDQTLRYSLDEWPKGNELVLPYPFQDTTGFSVVYYAQGSTSPTTWGSTNYWRDAASLPGRIVRKDEQSWPSQDLRSANAIEVTFRAGYGDQDDVPSGVKAAMRLVIGHWYANRESVAIGTISGSIALTSDSLFAAHMVPCVP